MASALSRRKALTDKCTSRGRGRTKAALHPGPCPCMPSGPRPLPLMVPAATRVSTMQEASDMLRSRATSQLCGRLPAVVLRPPPHVVAQQGRRGLLSVQVRPPRPWFIAPSSVLRDAGGARAPGATAPAAARHPYSPPIRGPRSADKRPAPTTTRGRPTDRAELSFTRLGPEAAAPKFLSQEARGSTDVEPPTCPLSWEE